MESTEGSWRNENWGVDKNRRGRVKKKRSRAFHCDFYIATKKDRLERKHSDFFTAEDLLGDQRTLDACQQGGHVEWEGKGEDLERQRVIRGIDSTDGIDGVVQGLVQQRLESKWESDRDVARVRRRLC